MEATKNIKPKPEIECKDIIPARYILTFLIFCGMCLIFGQRVCLNVAMVAMVNSSAEVEVMSMDSDTDESRCPVPESSMNVTLKSKQGSYLWTPSIQGVIIGSYFYGYVVAQIVGGRLADIFGAKRLFGCATFLSSVITCLTPYVSSLTPIWMIVLRVLLGFVHGMNYPSAYTLFARWAPLQERSTLLSLCVIGTHFGVVLSMPLTGYLCENELFGGWPSAFYALGIIGFVWFGFFTFFVYDSPADHPRISTREMNYIHRNIPFISNSKKSPPVPWCQVASSLPIWAVTIAKFCGAWSFICFQSKLPAYLDEVLHLPIHKNGLVNSLLFGALCFSIVVSGKLSDYIRAKEYFRTTTIRKCFETLALLGPAACMTAIPLVKCNANAVIILLTSAMALFGLCGGGDVSVIVDMAPDFAGKIFGVSNAIASIPGILSPIVAGYFLEGNKGNVEQWTMIFYISVALYVIGAITFLIFGSAEVQSWGVISPDKTEEQQQKERTISTISTTATVILSKDDFNMGNSSVVLSRFKRTDSEVSYVSFML